MRSYDPFEARRLFIIILMMSAALVSLIGCGFETTVPYGCRPVVDGDPTDSVTVTGCFCVRPSWDDRPAPTPPQPCE